MNNIPGCCRWEIRRRFDLRAIRLPGLSDIDRGIGSGDARSSGCWNIGNLNLGESRLIYGKIRAQKEPDAVESIRSRCRNSFIGCREGLRKAGAPNQSRGCDEVRARAFDDHSHSIGAIMK